MKSLDARLSEVVTPFDEIDYDQEDVTQDQYNQYRREALVVSISKKNGHRSFDLHFDDLIEWYEPAEIQLFLRECLDKLNEVYNLGVLYDFILREGILENQRDRVIKLIKYFVYDKWIDDIAPELPPIADMVSDKLAMSKMIREKYFDIQNKILTKPDLLDLVLFNFKFCARIDGIKTLTVLVFKDPVGVVSKQLEKKGEQDAHN